MNTMVDSDPAVAARPVGRMDGQGVRRATSVLAVTILGAMAVSSCGGGDSDEDVLALGTEAVVEFTSAASGDTAAVDTNLGVTALAVREGTQQQLIDGGFEIDEEIEDTTPYYVDVRYSNEGPGSMLRTLSVSMEDDDGNSLPTTLVIDIGGVPFEECPDVAADPFEPGDSYEGCTLFLVPNGTDPDKVLFVSQAPDASITFTYWAVD